MIKMRKELGLSIVLMGMLMSSANAACDSIFCIGGNVGVGGIYTDFGGNSRADGSFKGGYGAFELDLLIIRRLQVGLGFKGGSGSMGIYGSDLANNFDASLLGDKAGAFVSGSFKIGFNVASLESPLYINFISNMDGYIGTFGHGLGFYGAELQGRKSFGGRTSLLYSFGGAAAHAIYAFTQDQDNKVESGYGYSLFGSLGVDIGLTRNLGFYIKTIVRYYDIPANDAMQINNQVVSFPHTNAWATMLETGLRF
ncbi:hypothetical protein [Helicobacter trogontum]|uniref:hypothetical protein n=1 Tax=Helicobacter trogontum TaxID=50960 RepID=UPI000CF149B8|nr:hypothetical protein [Helicobacter trogontum]